MPNLFTNEEYADIHFIYGFCNGNAREAEREYARRFPNRRHPNFQVFIESHQRFREFGIKFPRRELDARNNRHRNIVLNLFDNDNRLSIRRASRQLRAENLNISKNKVRRILRKDGRRPYHLQPVQHLRNEDGPKRLNFCNWLLNSAQRDAQFIRKILWTDESQFTRRGVVNYHNLHVWSQENPREVRPRSFQTEFSVNVWLGIIDNKLVGPHFLPPRLNSALFLEFLEENLFNHLEDIPLNLREQMWIQMDGAPAHYGINVQQWLNNNYPRRWIGRFNQAANENLAPPPGTGPRAWPSRSPDLNALDFFVWGFIKDKVYATPVPNREELIFRIEQACDDLRNNPQIISAAVNSTLRRSQKCIEADGMHFEQLL